MGQRTGGRPRAEWDADGRARNRQPARRGRPEAIEDRTSHIDLRVVSMVEIDTNPDFDEWNDFLIDVDRRNHAKGQAKTLGGLAITYVPSKILNGMLREAKPRDYFDEKRKVKLFRGIASGIQGYIRDAAHTAANKRFDEVVGAHEAELARQREAVLAGTANGFDLDCLDGLGRPVDPGLTPEERLRMMEHPFGAVTMTVDGIQLYGRRKYGLNLSSNDAIYDVRDGLIGHLASEGLDVAPLRRDWTAHATIFEMHDHMGSGVALTTQVEMPTELKFDPPSVEMITVPRQAA